MTGWETAIVHRVMVTHAMGLGAGLCCIGYHRAGPADHYRSFLRMSGVKLQSLKVSKNVRRMWTAMSSQRSLP